MFIIFTMFIFRVAVEIKACLAIRDLRERRETKVKKGQKDQEEKGYVLFVEVFQRSTHSPTWNGLGILHSHMKFLNPKLKGHQGFYPHQAYKGVNLYLLTTFQLNSLLHLETS